MRVALLHDEISPAAREDELDTLVQAEAVESALAILGHSSDRLALSLDLERTATELRQRKPDLVFNLVESVQGRGSLVYLAPALLDTLNLPYTGAPTEATFLTSNKLLGKRVLRVNGLATPAWLTVAATPEQPLPLPGRFIIKSTWEHASVGMGDDAVIQASEPDDLRRALRARSDRVRGEVFAETFIPGREFNLTVLAGPNGREVMPPAEIHFVDYPPEKPRVVGYRAKWDAESFEYHHTPRCFDFPPADGKLVEELRRLALRCWDVFGLRGYARVDFRVDESGTPWILEVNTNPCLSPDAGFVAATQRAGLTFPQVVQRILDDAVAPPGAAAVRKGSATGKPADRSLTGSDWEGASSDEHLH